MRRHLLLQCSVVAGVVVVLQFRVQRHLTNQKASPSTHVTKNLHSVNYVVLFKPVLLSVRAKHPVLDVAILPHLLSLSCGLFSLSSIVLDSSRVFRYSYNGLYLHRNFLTPYVSQSFKSAMPETLLAVCIRFNLTLG